MLRRRTIPVDLLRGVALLGIMMNHVFGATPESRIWWDFHAIGFALLIGVGAGLAVPTRGARRIPMIRALIRAAVLAAIGFTLEMLPNAGIHIILVRFAIVTALVTLIAGAPRRITPWAAGILLLAAPLTGWLWQIHDPSAFGAATGWPSALHQETWMRMLLLPYYPALAWTGVAVIGLWAIRTFRLDRPGSLRSLAGAGLLLTLTSLAFTWVAWHTIGMPAGVDLRLLADGEFPTFTHDWRWLLGIGAYLPTTPSLLLSSGVVLLALALCSWLCLAPSLRAVLTPVATIGAMTLTGYTVHVLLEGLLQQWAQATTTGQSDNPLAAALAGTGLQPPTGWLSYGVQVALLAVLLLSWQRLPGRLGRGPLEWLSRTAASVAR
ncbi:hypothetical protein SAMN05421595_0047 [Austwickia chelonae]|uniref:Heparan-alpha-glucosaminide N-acetyltransferase catalytic domain-containing protein n=1 Tax=Austwickia chelonae NBRC 105200 TaxID=1184607 RepID=K6UNB3_9MICO|nr:hypothetical protein [Austwickia chelonae]GAB78836.1 hypothetical protein AUCHE_17_00480 [Austwickia chelonae NBRC 105200]SEV85066.1 hypothetical protein SAMN05421595_0047 [Austwickia chelonae]